MAAKKKTAVETLTSLGELNLEKMQKSLHDTQLQVQKCFAEVQSVAFNQFEDMKKIDMAIEAKNSLLKELHGIEAVANTLEALKEDMDSTRKRWQEEQSERAKAKARQEEEEEYEYNKRRREQLDRLNEELQEYEKDKNHEWAIVQAELDEREKTVKEKEAETEKLRETVANFDSTLNKAKQEAAGAAYNKAKTEYEFTIKSLNLDLQNSQKMFEGERTSLLKEINSLKETISNLREQLKECNDTIRQVSVGSTSGVAKAMADVMAKSKA